MLAHGTGPISWHDVPGAWTLDGPVLIGLVAVVALHVAAGRRRGDVRSRRGWAIAALVLAVVAFASPLDRLADALFSAHMVQHMVLIFGVAPALAVGRPWRTWRALLPRSWAVRVARLARSLHGDAASMLTSPMTTTTVAVAMLWFWHVPAMYELAVEQAPVHIVEHAALIVSWTALWVSVRTELKRGHAPTALGMLAVVSVSGNALGMLLVFTPDTWYTVHQWTATLHLSQAADQQLAGIVMWILPGFAVLGVMAHVFLAWLQQVPARSSVPG